MLLKVDDTYIKVFRIWDFDGTIFFPLDKNDYISFKGDYIIAPLNTRDDYLISGRNINLKNKMYKVLKKHYFELDYEKVILFDHSQIKPNDDFYEKYYEYKKRTFDKIIKNEIIEMSNKYKHFEIFPIIIDDDINVLKYAEEKNIPYIHARDKNTNYNFSDYLYEYYKKYKKITKKDIDKF